MPETLPDDPVLLKQLLLSLHEQMSSKDKEISAKDGQIERLREQNALLIQRLFGRKSEQSSDGDSPQLVMFNEAESLAEAAPKAPADEVEEEAVAPTKRRGKRKPLPAELPRVEVIHELPEHKLTCECGCRKQAIGEETSEQLEIIPMQVRVIRHIRKTYACNTQVNSSTLQLSLTPPIYRFDKSAQATTSLTPGGCVPTPKSKKSTCTPSRWTSENPSTAWPPWSNWTSRWRCSTRCCSSSSTVRATG